MSVGVWVIVAVVVVGVVFALFGWDRYRGAGRRRGNVDPYKPTDEVFVDPATGRRMRVWYSEKTGERVYRPDQAFRTGDEVGDHGHREV